MPHTLRPFTLTLVHGARRESADHFFLRVETDEDDGSSAVARLILCDGSATWTGLGVTNLAPSDLALDAINTFVGPAIEAPPGAGCHVQALLLARSSDSDAIPPTATCCDAGCGADAKDKGTRVSRGLSQQINAHLRRAVAVEAIVWPRWWGQ